MEMFSLLCSSDLKFWMTKVFDYDCKPYHLKWLNMMKTNKRVAIEAFTGSGKSELAAIVFPLWFLFHNKNKEVIIVSKSLNQSISLLERMIQIITENELLQSMIDPQKLRTDRWYTRSNSGARIYLTHGRSIRCAPYSENIRGFHVDLVVGDEISSYKDKDIWYRFVVTRVNNKNGSVIGISTPESPIDLMQELLENPEYVSDIQPVYDEDDKTVWPERFTDERIKKIKSEQGRARFEREYLCKCTAEVEGAIFDTEKLVDCTDISTGFTDKITEGYYFIGADFAISAAKHADFDVYFVVEKINGRVVIRDAFRGKGIPKDEKVRILDALCSKYPVMYVYLDDSGIGRAVADDLRLIGRPVYPQSFKPSERRNLLANLVTLVQSQELIIPYKVDDLHNRHEITKILVEEMLAFREVKSESTGNFTYKSEGAHDDTVMALALACKGARKISDDFLFDGGV